MRIAACTAYPVDLKDMGCHEPARTLDHLKCTFTENALFQILDMPTGFADKMMVVFLIGTEKIVLLAVGQEDAGNDAGSDQFIEDAVHGGKPDGGNPELDTLPDLIGREIERLVSQAAHDLQPLGGNLQIQPFKNFTTLFLVHEAQPAIK
jgi:hypothetical protein